MGPSGPGSNVQARTAQCLLHWILGCWGKAFFALYQALFPEGEPEDLEAFINASESNPLFKYISSAFDSIEQLCGLCKAPIVPDPLAAETELGSRKWKLEEVLGEGLWRAVDKSSMHGCALHPPLSGSVNTVRLQNT